MKSKRSWSLAGIGIHLGFLLVMVLLLLVLAGIGAAEMLVQGLLNLVSIRVHGAANRLVRIRGRLQDAYERVTAAIAICGEDLWPRDRAM